MAHTLADYAGKWIVLYFYPKDMTPGCTIEACDFRDNMARVHGVGAVALGVSGDSVKSHKKFVEKDGLNFAILADESHATLAAYGVWQQKSMMGKTYMGIARTTFLINPDGLIVKVYEGVNVKGHVDEVLRDLEAMK